MQEIASRGIVTLNCTHRQRQCALLCVPLKGSEGLAVGQVSGPAAETFSRSVPPAPKNQEAGKDDPGHVAFRACDQEGAVRADRQGRLTLAYERPLPPRLAPNLESKGWARGSLDVYMSESVVTHL